MRSPHHTNFIHLHFIIGNDDLSGLNAVVLESVVPHYAGREVQGDAVDEGEGGFVYGEPFADLEGVDHCEGVVLEGWLVSSEVA